MFVYAMCWGQTYDCWHACAGELLGNYVSAVRRHRLRDLSSFEIASSRALSSSTSPLHSAIVKGIRLRYIEPVLQHAVCFALITMIRCMLVVVFVANVLCDRVRLWQVPPCFFGKAPMAIMSTMSCLSWAAFSVSWFFPRRFGCIFALEADLLLEMHVIRAALTHASNHMSGLSTSHRHTFTSKIHSFV